jgi:hypothetical protein
MGKMEARKAYLFHGATPVTSIPTGEYDSRYGKLQVLSRVDDDDIEHAAYPHFMIKWDTNNLLPQGPHEYDNVHIRPRGIECGHSRCIVTTRAVSKQPFLRVPDGHVRARLLYHGDEVTGAPPGEYETDHGPITVTSMAQEESFSYPPYFWVKTCDDTVDTTMHVFHLGARNVVGHVGAPAKN